MDRTLENFKMKKQTLVVTLSLMLGLAGCSGEDQAKSTLPNTPEPTIPIQPEDPEPSLPPDLEPETPINVPQPKTYLNLDFTEIYSIPSDWNILPSNPGSIQFKEGALLIDGRKDLTKPTTIMLSSDFQKLRNYKIELEFEYLERNNGTRWGSIIYRASDVFAQPEYTPYYQFAIRADASAYNGLELALRRSNNTWNVINTSKFESNIALNTPYKATVVVHDQRVRHYLNDQLVFDGELPTNLNQGAIGLSAAGLLMKVNTIQVIEQLDALSTQDRITDVIDHKYPVAMAPALAQPADSLTNDNAHTATYIAYQLDEQLFLKNFDNKTSMHLRSLLSDQTKRTLPLLHIDSENTLAELRSLSSDYDFSDVTLVSDDPYLLRKARVEIPEIRTALDWSEKYNLISDQNSVVKIAQATNTSLSKIVILPAHLVQSHLVAHLQRLLITPWAGFTHNTSGQTSPKLDAYQAAEILTTGVNGIYTLQPELFHSIMRSMAPNTLLRKPLITGHRGIPSQVDENTLEGILKAIEVGADAVEYDVYLTKDDHVVLMHDKSVLRTTGIAKNIENMTLEEVRKLKTTGQRLAVPTMDEVLAAVVEKYPHVTNFIEIKSAKPEIISKIKDLLDKYNAYGQAIVISFDGQQILEMKNTLKGVSTGLLVYPPKEQTTFLNIRRILETTRQFSSTFNPNYSGLNQDVMYLASLRGVTFWPWTFRLIKNDFYRMYIQGTHGLTTDYAQDASNFVVKIKTPRQITATVGQPLQITGQKLTQLGQSSYQSFNTMLVLPGSAKYSLNGQSVSFSERGTAYVMPSYQYTIAPNFTYTIYAKPVTVTIQ